MPEPSSKPIKPIVLHRDGVITEDLWGYVTKKEEFKPAMLSEFTIKEVAA